LATAVTTALLDAGGFRARSFEAEHFKESSKFFVFESKQLARKKVSMCISESDLLVTNEFQIFKTLFFTFAAQKIHISLETSSALREYRHFRIQDRGEVELKVCKQTQRRHTSIAGTTMFMFFPTEAYRVNNNLIRHWH
jgi:hypothetical protein